MDALYKVVRRIRRNLGYPVLDDLSSFEVELAGVPDSEKSLTDVHRLVYSNDGPPIHKWRHYLSVYEHHLSRFRDTPVRVLELGVLEGGSLHLWRRYFGPKATIYGVDKNPFCARLDGNDGSVRIGSQADAAFLAQVVAEMGGIDVVIDDGSHKNAHQRASFDLLFPKLDPRGVYVCEDLHTSYWRGSFSGGYRRRSSFIEAMKDLVDDIHADFHRRGVRRAIDASRSISGIHFYNSVVVVEKTPQERPSSFRA